MATAIMRETLRTHVETLAGAIGERNIFRPRALSDAAGFITCEWRRQGYDVTPQTYECQGLPCANLEVTRRGASSPSSTRSRPSMPRAPWAATCTPAPPAGAATTSGS